MPRLLVGNLDCEREWAGRGGALGLRAARLSSAAATLLRGLAEEGDQLWTPLPVDPARCPVWPGAPGVELVSGPVRELQARAAGADGVLVWGATRAVRGAAGPGAAAAGWRGRAWQPVGGVEAARAGSDRRLALELAGQLGVGLPGARAIPDLETLRQHLSAGGAAAGRGRWVVKALHTAAGRDRVHGEGDVLQPAVCVAVARLLGRSPGLVFEPWCERVADLGCIGRVGPAGRPGEATVEVAPPHRLLCDDRGAFRGIAVAAGDPLELPAAWSEAVRGAASAAGQRLAALGHRGPFGIDAFAWRDPGGTVQLHSLCEINPRLTFGWVARAWSERLGTPLALHLGARPPAASAHPILLPGPDDPTAAWLVLGESPHGV